MTYRQSITIAADAAELFDLTQDYSCRLQWDPFLRSAKLLDGASSVQVGTRALCVAKNGWGMETVYISFNRPRTTAVKMTKGPWFLESFAGSWHFEPDSSQHTVVSFCYHLKARPGWLSWLLTPWMARFFAHDTAKRLVALKQAVEAKAILHA